MRKMFSLPSVAVALAAVLSGSLAVSQWVIAKSDDMPAAKSADPVASVPDDAMKAIVNGLVRANPKLKVEAVEPSPVPGLYKTRIENGPTLFVSADGKYMLATDMYRLELGHFVNLQELERQEMRVVAAADLEKNHDNLIVYSPKGKVKGVVNVFTDVDCGYCQKLHLEIAELNELGIEVRYLAYPRAGIGSVSYQKIASAWCAKDQNAAMDKLKTRQPLAMNVCEDNPVAEHFALGGELGVTGTPALLLADGTLLPGYLPAKELANRLGIAVQ